MGVGAITQLATERLGLLGAEGAIRVILALAVLLVGWMLARVVRGAIRRVVGRLSTDEQVDVILGRVGFWSTMIAAALIALGIVGAQVGQLVAGLGLVGAALTLALRDLLANVVSGLVLLVRRPFAVGDTIAVGEGEGVVLGITIRSTQLRRFDGRIAIVPNAQVLESVLVLSTVARRRIEIPVKVASGTDIESAQRVASRAIVGLPGVLSDPLPVAQAVGLDGAGVGLEVRYWIDTSVTDVPEARSAAVVALDRAWADAAIAMAEPRES